jgi:hypothetical protein
MDETLGIAAFFKEKQGVGKFKGHATKEQLV